MLFMEPMPPRRTGPRRLLMSFTRGRGWKITFFDPEQRRQLPRTLTFATADKILEMHERWGEAKGDGPRCAIERELQQGQRGSFWILLSEEQFGTLTAPAVRPAAAPCIDASPPDS
jgi:hypothetical protein